METSTFRAVVRGTNKQGVRVRRVRNVEAPSYEAAWISFEAIHAEMAKGLTNTTANVLPPVGWKLDGTISKGFEVAA
jgi:hypothetical protein